MKSYRLLIVVSVAVMICHPVIVAQEAHRHAAGTAERLGTVNFTISCKPATQEQFNRAVALLHSFWYEEAHKAFTEITKNDPDCAMAHWGIAMSLYYPLWQPPTAKALAQGWEAVQTAKSIGGKTEREKDYIAAIEVFYKDADKSDHRTRALAYEKAMEELRLRYPEDREAAVFYALALNGTALPTDKTLLNQRKAGAILEKVFAEQPDHPGVAHYIIHSYDSPPLAGHALDAARRYSKIAPSSPHALHMPSHIFTRLGLWEESIESNLASSAAAREHVAKTQPGAASFEDLHAMDYLEYAYLQSARDREAEEVLKRLQAMEKVDLENFAAAYPFAAIPARFTLERRRWSEAAALTLHPSSFPWGRFPWAEAMVRFARAIGASRIGDLARAREDVERLQSLHAVLMDSKESYWAAQVEIMRQCAAAWVALAEGRKDEALKLMRSAAVLESTTEKHPVTPGSVLPARELLGDMLLELREPRQALIEFERSLSDSPRRFNGLYGAARAAELVGDSEKARQSYAELVSICSRAEGERPELESAKAFLSQK